jgi:hypothetical protein
MHMSQHELFLVAHLFNDRLDGIMDLLDFVFTFWGFLCRS